MILSATLVLFHLVGRQANLILYQSEDGQTRIQCRSVGYRVRSPRGTQHTKNARNNARSAEDLSRAKQREIDFRLRQGALKQ